MFIVRDVNRRDMDQLAAAYRELFLASGGGALGLFTSVRVLRGVESRISVPLAEAGISEPEESLMELADVSPGSATFTLHRGEILGIAGLLGAGRTRLLRTIFGLAPIRSGRALPPR